MRLARELIAAAVPFYGIPPAEVDYRNLSAAVLGIYGAQDASIAAGAVGKVRTAIAQQSGRDPEFVTYPAGHAFLNDENLLGTYNPEQAEKAWARAVAFLHGHLGA
jgi:carboxymethylenebutenolidase